jgi:hypothetical protein
MVEVQNLRVIDKQSEMVLYHCHVVVVKYKHIQQGIQMIRSELEKTNEPSTLEYFVI